MTYSYISKEQNIELTMDKPEIQLSQCQPNDYVQWMQEYRNKHQRLFSFHCNALVTRPRTVFRTMLQAFQRLQFKDRAIFSKLGVKLTLKKDLAHGGVGVSGLKPAQILSEVLLLEVWQIFLDFCSTHDGTSNTADFRLMKYSF